MFAIKQISMILFLKTINKTLHITTYVLYYFMIKTFKCKETYKIYTREFSKKLPQDMQRIAYKKLLTIEASMDIDDLRIPPEIDWRSCQETGAGSLVYESINNIVSVLCGKMGLHLMLR